MAYGAGAFAQGLMGGLQTGFELADVRKAKKREQIAAQIAKEKVAADGAPTFDREQLKGQEHLISNLMDGMTPDQVAEYASMRRVPLGVEKSQALQMPEADLGALPMPNLEARTDAQKFTRRALPTAAATPVPAVNQKPYAVKDGRVEYSGPTLSAADEVESPKYQMYKDALGRERYTTQLRDRSKEEIAFDTASRLQAMGDMDGYEKYMKMYDTELERSSKKQAREMTDGLRQINAGLLTGKSDLMAKGLKNVFGAMQGNNDGVTYDMVRSPDGSQITLVGVDTASGMPLPSSVKDAPPGTLAVFKADPSSGMPAEAVMAGQLAAVATPEGMFNWTKQVMLGRKAVADLASSEASTQLNKTRADLLPQEFVLDKTYKLGQLGVAQQNANTAAFRASRAGSSAAAGAAAKDQRAWDKSVNGYVAQTMANSGLKPGTPEFARAAADARNGALQIFGPPPGQPVFDATGGAAPTTPAAPARTGGQGSTPPAALSAATPKAATAQDLNAAISTAKAAGAKASKLNSQDVGWIWQHNATNRHRVSINDAVEVARKTGKPEYQQGRQERNEAYRKRVAGKLGLTYPE